MKTQFKRFCTGTLALALLAGLTGCNTGTDQAADSPTVSATAETDGALDARLITVAYSDRDLSGAYGDDVTELTLGEGDVSITTPGTFILSGVLADGQILVDVSDTEKVQLVLNGVDITNSDGPAIYVKEADKVFLTLAAGTTNRLADGSAYRVEEDENDPNACVFSQGDLTINGTGSLTVTGNYNHAVVSKDDLTITDGVLNITAVNDGLKGKDAVQICGGAITIGAGGDGVQSSNTTDGEKGYVAIDGGTLDITAQGDGIQAETQLQVTGGVLTVTTGGGADNAEAHVETMGGRDWFNTADSQTVETVSAKGLKAGTDLLITGGTVEADCCDDAVHSNAALAIAGGTLTLSTGDDGVHAGDSLEIMGGVVTVLRSYEGLEGCSVVISGGDIDVTASDDGINAAGGDDGGTGGWFGGDSFGSGTEAELRITGGTIAINASGDGVDSNGPITMEGGALYISGPADGGNGAIDVGDGYEASITGGTVAAAGAQQMAENFGSASTQYSFLISLGGTVTGGTGLTVTDEAGDVVLSFTPENDYQCVLVSTPELIDGGTYTVVAGETTASITLSGVTTSDVSVMGMGGGMGDRRPGMSTDGTAPTQPPERPTDLPQDGGRPGDRGGTGDAAPAET